MNGTPMLLAQCSVRHRRHCYKMDRLLLLKTWAALVLYGCPHTRDSLRTTYDLILKSKLNLHLHGFIQSCWSFCSKVTSSTDSTRGSKTLVHAMRWVGESSIFFLLWIKVTCTHFRKLSRVPEMLYLGK